MNKERKIKVNMAPVKLTRSKEKEGAKCYEDQDTRIQGICNIMITMAVVIQKGMDESNARFDSMFEEMIDHKDGTARMLQDFERAAVLETEKSEKDRKVTASTFLAELASMKQEALDACTTAKANINNEDDETSPERVASDPHGLNPADKPKRLFLFASIDKSMSVPSKWKLELVPYLNGKELSTHLQTVKIDGDAIQDMKKLHGQVSIIFFVATNGLVILPNFESLD